MFIASGAKYFVAERNHVNPATTNQDAAADMPRCSSAKDDRQAEEEDSDAKFA